MTRRIAAVALVDARGWLLLQERDEQARADRNRWSLVGGGVEPGESDLEAAERELAEETEITGVDLEPLGEVRSYCVDCAETHEFALFTAVTDLTDVDVVGHEGRRIVFVDPTTIHTLDWSRGLVAALPRVMRAPSYVARFGRREPRRFGCALLVDPAGRVLLQERDEHAPIDPERWGLPGGHLEPGEDHLAGTLREIEEETGVRLAPGALELVDGVHVFHPHYGSVDGVRVFAARVALTDDDIDCHEGRRIVFVPPDEARDLDLTMTGSLVVPAFLDSDHYRALSS